ncbi:MAG: RNA 2',3'-cyclic phosphodiesterase [Alphaproteobacteria bacterium]|jgi:RNA 2',3'-cyclic 3'-phosphodiesterase|nr:RNA 2',3'-cyclic phosphodiesterase [Alphaproteobacteria bacterium]MBT7943109.1 RNA 2',3'-cyclic phosphodiesterase [Alphaproteobacteria bacterium]
MRLFVGLSLPDDVRALLGPLKGGLPGARWIEDENLHLSLRFIGDVTGGDERDIDLALQLVSGKPFDVTLAGLGTFERRGRVHSLWVGLKKADAAVALHDRIESALVRAKLEPEHRKFKAHVTLARLKNGSAADAALYLGSHAGFKTPAFTVNHFTLFESHLGHLGAQYVALADYPLVG